MYDLSKIFYPKNVAVIGISFTNDRHPANVIYNKNHLRYPVNVYPVNPKGGILQREPVYPSVRDIPVNIDLAIICVKAEFVPQIIKDCIDSNVGGAIVISGGFSEVGEDSLQKNIAAMAKEANFPFIGPNCLGLYNPANIDSLFLPAERIVHPPKGGVTLVSQSGGILIDQMVNFKDQGIGMSIGVSIGNKALIKETALLDFFENDPNTKVIAFYLEGFDKGEGRNFVEVAERCTKPITIIKSGKTAEGSKAVSSHTASIAGDYNIFSQVLRQKGIIEAIDNNEFISFCESLYFYQKSIGPNIGIITGSGGHGAIAVDKLKEGGLEIPNILDSDKTELKKLLSPSIQNIASLSNPIDLTGSASDIDFLVTVEYLSKIQYLDALILLLLPYLPGISLDLSARISKIAKDYSKPLIAYIPNVDKFEMLVEGFEINNIPVASTVENAVSMAKALYRRR